MAKVVSDLLVERLLEWGVDTIFGLPGDGVDGFFEALRTHQGKMRFIQVRLCCYVGAGRYSSFEWTVLDANPEFGVELQPIDFAKVAEACGLAGFKLENPKDAERVLSQACAMTDQPWSKL